MPTGAYIASADISGDATGALTARAADDVIGALQTSGSFASVANQTIQRWGMRRFVSAPLAAQTISFSSTWTCSAARSESNTSHNQALNILVYCWRPSTGATIGDTTINRINFIPSAPVSTAELTFSIPNSVFGTDLAISDGDILVFEVSDQFTQGMSTSYTSTFFYDGTTEASTISCASFVTPPAALTLFTAATAGAPKSFHQSVPFYPHPSRPS